MNKILTPTYRDYVMTPDLPGAVLEKWAHTFFPRTVLSHIPFGVTKDVNAP